MSKEKLRRKPAAQATTSDAAIRYEIVDTKKSTSNMQVTIANANPTGSAADAFDQAYNYCVGTRKKLILVDSKISCLYHIGMNCNTSIEVPHNERF